MLKIVGQIPLQNLHNATLSRSLSTSSSVLGYGYKKQIKDHNVTEFKVHNRLGTKQFKKEQFNKYKPKYPDVPIHKYGVRDISINHPAKPEFVREMVPDLVVPDLEGCELKPYVPYNTQDIYQDAMTAQDLFNAIYGPKIVADFKEGKLDENGNALEPNEHEQLSQEEAFIKARQTGSDIFQGGEPENPIWKLEIPVGKH